MIIFMFSIYFSPTAGNSELLLIIISIISQFFCFSYTLVPKDKFVTSSKFILQNSSGFVNIEALIAAPFETDVVGLYLF